MNLTRQYQYNKQVSGLKRPSSIMSQEFKLIFVYPMLIDEHVANMRFNTYAKDNNTMQDLVRSFFTVSILTEILTANTLNLVGLASQIDYKKIEKKSDENIAKLLKGKEGNVHVHAGGGPYGVHGGDGKEDKMSSQRHELQQKINDKLTTINQILTTDPKLKRLFPFIEIVTLQNMIDVPVITGTSVLPADPLSLYSILVGSVALNKPLDRFSNVQQIVSTLKQRNNDLTDIILNAEERAEDTKKKSSIFSKIKEFIKDAEPEEPYKRKIDVSDDDNYDTHRFPTYNQIRQNAGKDKGDFKYDKSSFKNAKWKSKDKFKKSRFGIKLSQRAVDKSKGQLDTLDNEVARENITKFLQDKLETTEVFFKLSMDPGLLYKRNGLTKEAGQMKTVVSRTHGSLMNFLSTVHGYFGDFLSGQANILIRSFHNILFPDSSTDIDYFSIKKEIFDEGLLGELTNYLDEHFLMDLQSTVEATNDPKTAESLIKPLKSLCETVYKSGHATLDSFGKIIEKKQIPSIYFNESELNEFLISIEKLSTNASAMNKRFESSLSRVLNNAQQTLPQLKILINDAVDNFIQKYASRGYVSSKTPSRIFFLLPDNQRDNNTYQTLLTQINTAMSEYLYFGFLAILQLNLCKYIDILDAEVEVATQDVLELPNYTLVIPMEVILALHQVILQKNWKNMVLGKGGGARTPPTETYAKGIIKFVTGKLGVPNLIVIDESKSLIWYKFQYMSDVFKIKFSAADTFVKTHLTRQQSQVDKTSQYY